MRRCGPGVKMEDDIWSFAWSPTEACIVTSPYDGVLRKWSDVFGSPKRVAESCQNHEYARLEYSPDGRIIASFNEMTAKLWDASNLSLLWQSSGGMVWYCSVAFHPLGHRVVFFKGSAVDDANVEDLRNVTATKRSLPSTVSQVVFDPSGITCAIKTPKGVKVLCADSFEEKCSLPYGYVLAMRFTPDSKYILLVLESKILVLWDIAVRAIVRQLTIDIPKFDVWGARISNDCRVVHVCGYVNTSHLIRLTY